MPTRHHRLGVLFVTALVALAGCAVAPPSGPTITALPGPGKSFPQFQQDDDNCRGYAANRTANAPAQAAAASNNANATAVAGTLIGAGLGAALGSLSGNAGAGAAVGAGAGLLAGASTAGDQAQGAADSLQQQYDAAYAQCMVGNGEALQGQPVAAEGNPGPSAADVLVPAIAAGAAAAIIVGTQHDEHQSPGPVYHPAATPPAHAAAETAPPAPAKKDKKDKKPAAQNTI